MEPDVIISSIERFISGKEGNNKNLTKESLRNTIIARSLAIFEHEPDLSKLSKQDYKDYSNKVDTTIDKLSSKDLPQAKEIKKDIGTLTKLKKKVFTALKEEIISMTTGIPDEIFDVIDVSKEVKKTFTPRMDPHKSADQQYAEFLSGNNN